MQELRTLAAPLTMARRLPLRASSCTAIFGVFGQHLPASLPPGSCHARILPRWLVSGETVVKSGGIAKSRDPDEVKRANFQNMIMNTPSQQIFPRALLVARGVRERIDDEQQNTQETHVNASSLLHFLFKDQHHACSTAKLASSSKYDARYHPTFDSDLSSRSRAQH